MGRRQAILAEPQPRRVGPAWVEAELSEARLAARAGGFFTTAFAAAHAMGQPRDPWRGAGVLGAAADGSVRPARRLDVVGGSCLCDLRHGPAGRSPFWQTLPLVRAAAIRGGHGRSSA